MMNVVEFLRKRQIGAKSGNVSGNVVKCLYRRIVPLYWIVDPRLIHGHVILGFSQCGRYLLSYTECIGETHEYTLHWWTYNLYHPISHLSKHPLFRSKELELVVCLTPDLQHTLVHGSVREEVDCKDRRTCHVTLLPGPGQYGPTIQLQYELLPPCPAFLDHLALQIPGCVLLNTGDRLVAVHYDPTHQATHSQWFSDTPSSQDSPIECSPSNLLPVTVLQDSLTLTPNATKGVVWVGQTVLDIEEWTSHVFPVEMSRKGLFYHCLLDYDMELVQVCVEMKVALFVMEATLEIFNNDSGCRDCVSVEVMGAWNVCDGVTVVRSVTAPTCVSHNHTVPPASVSARAASLRAQTLLPTSPQCTVRTYSNHTVFSGRSLKFIHHPLLPITLALGKRKLRTS